MASRIETIAGIAATAATGGKDFLPETVASSTSSLSWRETATALSRFNVTDITTVETHDGKGSYALQITGENDKAHVTRITVSFPNQAIYEATVHHVRQFVHQATRLMPELERKEAERNAFIAFGVGMVGGKGQQTRFSRRALLTGVVGAATTFALLQVACQQREEQLETSFATATVTPEGLAAVTAISILVSPTSSAVPPTVTVPVQGSPTTIEATATIEPLPTETEQAVENVWHFNQGELSYNPSTLLKGQIEIVSPEASKREYEELLGALYAFAHEWDKDYFPSQGITSPEDFISRAASGNLTMNLLIPDNYWDSRHFIGTMSPLGTAVNFKTIAISILGYEFKTRYPENGTSIRNFKYTDTVGVHSVVFEVIENPETQEKYLHLIFGSYANYPDEGSRHLLFPEQGDTNNPTTNVNAANQMLATFSAIAGGANARVLFPDHQWLLEFNFEGRDLKNFPQTQDNPLFQIRP